MSLSARLVVASLTLALPGCCLVTVPVTVGGKVLETTVKTAGDVVTAPFNALAGEGDSATRRDGEPAEPSDAKSTSTK